MNPKEEWVIVPDAFPAIISYQQADGIYQKAQQNKNIAPNKGLKQPSKYLLTGLIVCPVCQSHFVVNSDHRRKQYHYICGTRNRISQGYSNKLWIQMKRFEDQLMSQIEGVIFQDGPLEEYLRLCQENQPDYEREAKKEIAARQQKIKAADNRMKNLVNALADNILPAETIQAKYAEEENKARQIRHELHQLEQQPVAEVIDLPKFRHLLKEELQQEDARKAAMTGLISKIQDLYIKAKDHLSISSTRRSAHSIFHPIDAAWLRALFPSSSKATQTPINQRGCLIIASGNAARSSLVSG